jgi:hypothetical protein
VKLEFKIEALAHGHDARVGRYEVFAPEGYHFNGGEHSLLCYSHQEARHVVKTNQVYPCDADCVCKEEA